MSRIAPCPSCGANVQFHFSSAVQSACPYCRAILVRHDVDLEKVGEVADLPPDPSPIQLLTEGIYDGQRFLVVGRIAYEWEQGFWNEWHLLFSNGSNGWLADAMAQYAVSFLTPLPGAVPGDGELRRGMSFRWPQGQFVVTHLTRARYAGFEGELPFRTTDRTETLFADLRTNDARFATLDYSESPPLLFLGRLVSYDELKLTNLKQFEGW